MCSDRLRHDLLSLSSQLSGTPHFLPQKGKANTDQGRGSTESADNINAPLTAKEISAMTATVQVTIVVVSHNQENNSNK